jgi:hypothetical protein
VNGIVDRFFIDVKAHEFSIDLFGQIRIRVTGQTVGARHSLALSLSRAGAPEACAKDEKDDRRSEQNVSLHRLHLLSFEVGDGLLRRSAGGINV